MRAHRRQGVDAGGRRHSQRDDAPSGASPASGNPRRIDRGRAPHRSAGAALVEVSYRIRRTEANSPHATPPSTTLMPTRRSPPTGSPTSQPAKPNATHGTSSEI